MNNLIEQIFADYSVPLAFVKYRGSEETYMTYQQTQIDTTYDAEDELLYYVDYYDIDVYSKANYLQIIEDVKNLMKQNGFRWQPDMSSGDLYEEDTRYFHKTLCFSIERMEEKWQKSV